MKKLAGISVFLLLTLAAPAQRSTGTILHTLTGVFYGATTQNFQLVIQAEVTSDPVPNPAAWLYISIADQTTGRFLFAAGSVPPSVLKVEGNSLVIQTNDLSQFVGPNFNFQNSGFTDLSVDCTMTRTLDWQEKDSDVYTVRTPQPDGSLQVTTEAGKGIRFSIAASGKVIGYAMPLPPEDVWEAGMYQGRYRDHVTP